MHRSYVRVSTPDGECPAAFVHPEGAGPWPAVVLYMDAGGLRETLVGMAEQIAGDEYAVLVPELYHRHLPYAPFDPATVFDDAPERERLMTLMNSVTREQAMRDTAACLDWLDNCPDVRGGGVGCTGYCMGGGLALTAAGTFPGHVAAAASFHGGSLATDEPDSPHRFAPAIRARVHVGIARDDASFPPDQRERLAAALADAGVNATMETYDAAHGFAVPDIPTYDEAAARRHLGALRGLLAATL